MNYLIYVERAAENLQFYLWHRDYVKRFQEASTTDTSLAREWTQDMEDEALARVQKDSRKEPGPQSGPAADMLKGTDFEDRTRGFEDRTRGHPATLGDGQQGPQVPADESNPFHTPPRSAGQEWPQGRPGENVSDYSASNAMSYRSQATDAFGAAGARLPCMMLDPWCERPAFCGR